MLAFALGMCYITTCPVEGHINGPLAQLVEHMTLNQGVQGSSPWRST